MNLERLLSEVKFNLEEERLSIRTPKIIMEKLKEKASYKNRSVTDEIIKLMVNEYGWDFLFIEVLENEELQQGIKLYINTFKDEYTKQILYYRILAAKNDSERAEELTNEILNFIFSDSDRITLRKLRKIINLDNKYFIEKVYEINESIKEVTICKKNNI